jgi:signal transduction histidine kinase
VTRTSEPGHAGQLGIGRGRGLSSVRRRLQLITVIPLLGLVALAALQARASAAVVADSSRAMTLATTSTATVELLHQLGREQAEAVALRDRGGIAGALLVSAQQARSDQAVTSFVGTLTTAAMAAPGLGSVIDSVRAALAELPSVRALASPEGGSTTGVATGDVQSLYAPASSALMAVADAIPGQIVDRELSNMTRAVAALAAAKVALAGQRDALRTAFRHHSWPISGLAAAVRLAAIERERLESFRRVATANQRAAFDRLVRGADVEAAGRIRDAALSGAPDSLGVDSDAWYVAMSHTIRWLHEVELAVATDVAGEAARERDTALSTAVITIAGAVVLAVAAAAITAAVATRTSRQLGDLRDAALRSSHELPSVVEDIATAADPARTHAAHIRRLGERTRGGEHARVDEIGQVSSAFTVVQTTALQLAADQALLRHDIEALVVALARRSQKLVQRQFSVIDDLERSETDPDTLSRYYAIDHLAARMRRNDENLLVLAGAEPGRRFTGTFPLLDVVRAASAEIADYARIDTSLMPDVAIAGHVVGDLVHLMAELLENAAKYSPPHSKVRLAARHTIDGFHIAIYDDGIGLTAEQLAVVNARLARPTILTSALAGTLGLLVVARLAARHAIQVELRSNRGAGTAASIRLPHGLLVQPAERNDTPRGPSSHQTTSAWIHPPASSQRIASGQTVEFAGARIYDDLTSAWFGNNPPRPQGAGSAGSWSAPGDAEHARVAELTRAEPQPNGGAMPKRQRGANLHPGAVPDVHDGPQRKAADPDWIRAQLSGLSRGVAAARRTLDDYDEHTGRTW